MLNTSAVSSLMECSLKCTKLRPRCKSFNYIKETSLSTICELNNITKHLTSENEFVRQINSDYFELIATKYDETLGKKGPDVYIKDSWTLIARFSNTDEVHWMEDNGTWWYDREEPYGKPLDPGDNVDMISEAFWLKGGTEFKITLNNDITHTALLTTTGNCLGGKTFRKKISSYGKFRGLSVWATDQCLGSCSVIYGGNYENVEGFAQSKCDGSVQTRNNIGFWCDYGSGDGSVLMIGGGGSACKRADHGIGITEENSPTFQSTTKEYDFGNDANGLVSTFYSLNLWVR